jgi:hypothetical protein
LRVFDNRVLERVFRCKCEEATGRRTQFHSEDIHKFLSSTNTVRINIIWKNGRAWHVERKGEKRSKFKM